MKKKLFAISILFLVCCSMFRCNYNQSNSNINSGWGGGGFSWRNKPSEFFHSYTPRCLNDNDTTTTNNNNNDDVTTTSNQSLPTTANAAAMTLSRQSNSRATYFPTQPDRVYFERTHELNPPPPSYAEITKENNQRY
jgi:hypothetical protein